MQLGVELLLVPEDAVSTGDKKFNLLRCHSVALRYTTGGPTRTLITPANNPRLTSGLDTRRQAQTRSSQIHGYLRRQS